MELVLRFGLVGLLGEWKRIRTHPMSRAENKTGGCVALRCDAMRWSGQQDDTAFGHGVGRLNFLKYCTTRRTRQILPDLGLPRGPEKRREKRHCPPEPTS